MTTSEPTTGEIVRALRVCDVGRCIDCNIDEKYPCENLKTYAADRLKSQEQTIAALTARAEQAEQDRDLAIKALADYEDAIDPTVEQIMREFHGTEQRGQPQDGEGK